MMNPYMWDFMSRGGYGGSWMWFGLGFWGVACIIITIEVIILLWLWIKKLWKEVK